ncbi:hypothetical protein DICVIV_13957 [Dictyocaulus viviparus]|uniref:Uncharacterized protein n=1 Tax=Dictyocaulus viviparus TaxID=29172 RepID=A0A0D8X6E4_DICVI|nr:hypothetical protein DICVIV_13957 [Dictyocaulus viviparus]
MELLSNLPSTISAEKLDSLQNYLERHNPDHAHIAQTTGSKGRGKKGKKGKKGKSVVKRKRRKDRYESQNYLLRIEGTLCCASIRELIACIWIVSLYIVMLIINGDCDDLQVCNGNSMVGFGGTIHICVTMILNYSLKH